MQDRLGLMEQLGLVRPVGDVNWADSAADGSGGERSINVNKDPQGTRP